MARYKSRPTRWVEACGVVRNAIDSLRGLAARLTENQDDPTDVRLTAEDKATVANFLSYIEQGTGELVDLQAEYQEWFDNLNEGLQQAPVGEKLQEVIDLDLESAQSAANDLEAETIQELVDLELDEIESAIDDAEGADLPRGWGKD